MLAGGEAAAPYRVKVAAVILSYGGHELSRQLADALLAEDEVRAVVLVDNPRSPRLERRWRDGDRLTVLQCPVNRGYAAMANAAVAELGGTAYDWLVVATSGVDLQPTALATLWAAASRSAAGILAPILSYSTSGDTFSAGGVYEHGEFVHRVTEPQPGALVPALWVDGAFMLIRRAVVTAVDGFDESLFLYCEDIDFCVRARAAGWQTVVVADARGSEQPSARERPTMYAYLSTRNSLVVARRAGGSRYVARTMRSRVRAAVGSARVAASPRSTSEHSDLARRRAWATLCGIVDYTLGRDGPPPRALR